MKYISLLELLETEKSVVTQYNFVVSKIEEIESSENMSTQLKEQYLNDYTTQRSIALREIGNIRKEIRDYIAELPKA